jgi:hypothetical protein
LSTKLYACEVCVWLPTCRYGVRLVRYLKHLGSDSAGTSKLIVSLEPGSCRPGSYTRATRRSQPNRRCMGEPAMGAMASGDGVPTGSRDPCPLAWLRRDQSTTKAKPIAKQRGGPTVLSMADCMHGMQRCLRARLLWCGGVWSLTACGLLSLFLLASASRRASAETDGSR